MAYYLTNKLPSTNISMNDLYEIKRVNKDQDKTTNLHQTAYGSNVSGSHLGPGINPWQSYNRGYGDTDNRVGMIGFNSPTVSTSVALGELRGYDWKFHPGTWGDRNQGYNCYVDTTTSTLSAYDDIQNPGWNMGKYTTLWIYTMEDPSGGMALNDMNWCLFSKRLISGTNSLVVAVGTIIGSGTGNSISSINYTTQGSWAGSNGQLVPSNLGQGESTPYSASTQLGSSTQFVAHYRNGSNLTRARVITLNTLYNTTPTISVGAERSPTTSQGNPVYGHGGINMGKGTTWAGLHRGANYQRISYANWTSGTTFGTFNTFLVSSRSASNTLGNGWLVKLTDESAIWFFNRRSGNSSGLSRVIAATVLETSGANKIPAVRGSTEAETFDIGSISTQANTAAVGSSDTAGTVFGVTAWAETSAGNEAFNIMPWEYRASTNDLTFHSGSIHLTDTAYTGTNTYRMHTGVKCLGYNSDEEANYYEFIIPQGESSGVGFTRLVIKQDARVSGTGTITETLVQDPSNTEFGTDARIMCQQSFANYPTGRQWFLGGGGIPRNYQGPTWTIYPFIDTNGNMKLIGRAWNQTM